jgi:hypothetical protein
MATKAQLDAARAAYVEAITRSSPDPRRRARHAIEQTRALAAELRALRAADAERLFEQHRNWERVGADLGISGKRARKIVVAAHARQEEVA